MSKGQKLKYNW